MRIYLVDNMVLCHNVFLAKLKSFRTIHSIKYRLTWMYSCSTLWQRLDCRIYGHELAKPRHKCPRLNTSRLRTDSWVDPQSPSDTSQHLWSPWDDQMQNYSSHFQQFAAFCSHFRQQSKSFDLLAFWFRPAPRRVVCLYRVISNGSTQWAGWHLVWHFDLWRKSV